eukprot:g4399.t1
MGLGHFGLIGSSLAMNFWMEQRDPSTPPLTADGTIHRSYNPKGETGQGDRYLFHHNLRPKHHHLDDDKTATDSSEGRKAAAPVVNMLVSKHGALGDPSDPNHLSVRPGSKNVAMGKGKVLLYCLSDETRQRQQRDKAAAAKKWAEALSSQDESKGAPG